MGPAQVSGTLRTQKSQHSTRSQYNKKTQGEESEDLALSTSRSFANCVTCVIHSFIHPPTPDTADINGQNRYAPWRELTQ